MKNEGKIQTSMTTDNRRKEEESKSKTEESRENLVPLANSAVVDKAERNTSILPSSYDTYIPTVESVVGERNMQKAIKAVIRDRKKISATLS